MRAAGGGDVKLFAALGAITGAQVGLELQFAGYALALAYTLVALLWHGELQATCTRALALLVAPITRGRVPRPPLGAMVSVRLGVPVLVAVVLLIAQRALERSL
jgi:Flp pilus assembly protein protease CpaA